jgi:uncharacterized protein (DUF952 family)
MGLALNLEVMMDQIVHICTAADWQTAKSSGEYRADSLETEAFIHCSRPEQVLGVANRYYHGHTDLVLLWINPSKLSVELRWEVSEGDIYPHIFGPIDLEAIHKVSNFNSDQDGIFRILPETNFIDSKKDHKGHHNQKDTP